MKKNIFIFIAALVVALTGINNVSAETISVAKNSNMAHIDANSNNSLDFGEEVCIGNECFYVINVDTDSNKVKLLTKYNLKVGYRVHAQLEAEGFKRFSFEMTDPTGIQDSTALGGFYGQVNGDFTGTVDFDETKINGYISNYMDYLKETYGVDATGEIMDANIVHIFGCDINENCDSTPEWFRSTSYWINILGSQTRESAIVRDELTTEFLSPKVDLDVTNTEVAGVRPVVTVEVQLFDTYKVNVEEPDNGSLEVVEKDGGIVITVKPDEGFELDVLEVVDSNNDDIEVTDNGDGTYTITKLSSDANVNVTFKEVEEDTTDENTEPSTGTTENEVENPNTYDGLTISVLTLILSFSVIFIASVYLKKQNN